MWIRGCLLLLGACLGCAPESGEPSPLDGAVDAPIDAGVDAEPDAQLVDAQLVDAQLVDAASEARVTLVEHHLWTRLEPADDPFTDAPEVVDCRDYATIAQELGQEPVFDVETGFCNYVTVQQPALEAVAAGSTIKVRLWHFDLLAPQPAEAHVAVTVDGEPILDERVPIPAQGGLIVRELPIPRDIARGAPVLFHLHNHGANSWALVEVSKSSD